MASEITRSGNMGKTGKNFEIRFIGEGISPESVPLRAMSDALSAIQDIASGRDIFETSHVPDEKLIGLVKVRRGSAVYSCVARSPEVARRNLGIVGQILSSPDDAEIDEDILVGALRPINTLSGIARSTKCRLEITWANGRRHPLLTVQPDDYSRISTRVLLHGETSINGIVERVGGATGTKCVLRVPGRARLLYCDVDGKDLARKLGQHLYEQITANGTATWIHKSWRIYHFKIRGFVQPRLGNPEIAIKDLRDAGLSSWDTIDDPGDFLRKIR